MTSYIDVTILQTYYNPTSLTVSVITNLESYWMSKKNDSQKLKQKRHENEGKIYTVGMEPGIQDDSI